MIHCEAEIYERWLSDYLFDQLQKKDAQDLRAYLAQSDSHVTQFYDDLLVLRHTQQVSDGCDAAAIARALETRLHAETEASKRLATDILQHHKMHSGSQRDSNLGDMYRKGVALLMAAAFILVILYSVLKYVSDIGQSVYSTQIQYASADVQILVGDEQVSWSINEPLPEACRIIIPADSHLAFAFGDGSQCQLTSGSFILRLQGKRELFVQGGQCDWQHGTGPQVLIASSHGEVAMQDTGALRLHVDKMTSRLYMLTGTAQMRVTDDTIRSVSEGEFITFGEYEGRSQL